MTLRSLLVVLVGGGLVLGGCAGLGQRIEPPEVFVVDLAPEQGGKLEQRFRIDLRIQNPNDFELEIDGFDFDLDLNGVRLTRGMSNEAVTIPRLGDAVVGVSATTSVFDLFRQVVNAPGQEGVGYELRGRLFLVSPKQGPVDFSRSGRIFR